MATVKRILFINRRGPYGSIYAQEALEVALIGAAFDQRIAMAFLDDGVFLLRRGQDTRALGMKEFTAAYRALGDYEVERIYVERESLAARGMGEDDLMNITTDEEGADAHNLVQPVSSTELADIIESQDVLLNQ